MHINYLFTNDYEYLHNYTTFIPKQEKDKDKEKIVDSKNIFIREIRNRIEAYFKLILKNLRDEVPKTIGTFLVNGTIDKMQLYVYNKIYQGGEIMEAISEDSNIAQRRLQLTNTLKVLREAHKEIGKNKDLLDVMQIEKKESFLDKVKGIFTK